jgi:hypothetical protein
LYLDLSCESIYWNVICINRHKLTEYQTKQTIFKLYSKAMFHTRLFYALIL